MQVMRSWGLTFCFSPLRGRNRQRAAALLLWGKKLLPVSPTSQTEVISEFRQEADKRVEKEHSLLFFKSNAS